MTEPSNAVLAEQLRHLRKELIEHKRVNRIETRELERDISKALETTNTLNITMEYVKEAVSDMKEMMSKFVAVQNTQNDTINDFVNSDKRMSHKRQLVVAILQVVSGIVIATIGIWGAGKL